MTMLTKGGEALLFGEYGLGFVFEDPAILSPMKGSALRGLFGAALKRVTCVLRRNSCTECLLNDRCVYSIVFETPAESRDGSGPSPPHPFVMGAPLCSKTDFSPGDLLDVTFLVFGGANEHLPYYVCTFEEMGRMGIGPRVNGRRAGFALAHVSYQGLVIYDRQQGRLARPDVEDLVLEPCDRTSDRISTIILKLITPLRLKYCNKLHAELPFHVLVRAMLRRFSALNTYYGDGEPFLDYRGLVARAQNIPIVESSIRWFDWKRYSNRQDQSMLMGGMIGTVTYEGPLDEFLPLMTFCEKVHIGKATTFGLGKIRTVRR